MTNPNTESVYKFICVYVETNDISPTQREIASYCYLAVSSVFAHLNRLEAQGRIKRDPHKPRGIIVISR